MFENIIKECNINVNGSSVNNFVGTIADIKTLTIWNMNSLLQISPDIFNGMDNLKELSLHNVFLTDYIFLEKLKKIEALLLSHVPLKEIPSSVSKLTQLKVLYIEHAQLSDMNLEWGLISNLKRLGLSYNNITTIPPSFEWHQSLEHVSFSYNPIEEISFDSVKESNLERLDLDDTLIADIPNSIQRFISLKTLYLIRCKIITFPNAVMTLPKLEELYLLGNDLSNVSSMPLTQNFSVLFLDLTECNLTEIPICIKYFRGLYILLLEENKIQNLPDWLDEIQYLKQIHLAHTLINEEQIELFKNKFPERKWMILS